MKKVIDPVKIAKKFNLSIVEVYSIVGIDEINKKVPKSRLATLDFELEDRVLLELKKIAKAMNVSVNSVLVHAIVKRLDLDSLENKNGN